MTEPIRTFHMKETMFLSNFYPHRKDGSRYPHDVIVVFEGLEFDNVECAYMAAKTFDQGLRNKIQKMTPREAKTASENGEIPLREDWEEVKIGFMTDFVGQKFRNSPALAKMLLDTQDAELTEGNDWGDTFWGVDLETGKGENNLGKILMALRAKLRAEITPEATEKTKPQEITIT